MLGINKAIAMLIALAAGCILSLVASSACSSGSNFDDTLGKGNAYFAQGDYEKAVEAFDEVIRLNPQDSVGYKGRGLAYGRLDQYEQAIADYNEAIRFNPKDSTVYNSRGILYFTIGQYTRAIADYDEVIRLNPQGLNLAMAYYGKGMIYETIGNSKESERNFKKAKELGFSR